MSDALSKLKRIAPIFGDRAREIASTDNSLIVEDGGTIVKAYRNAQLYPQDTVRRHIQSEANALQFFNGRIGEFSAPKLFDEPTFLKPDEVAESGFIGIVKMSKMSGIPASHFLTDHSLNKNLTDQMGRLIASSHKIGAAFNQTSPSEHGAHIITCDDYSPEMKEKINIANAWFKDNQSSGFAHADVHYDNIFIDADGRNVLGFIDFSCSGHHQNPFGDMRTITSAVLPYAQEGYTQEWGDAKGIDKMREFILFSRLSYFSSYIHYIANKPDHDSNLIQQKSADMRDDLSSFLSVLELN